MNCLVLTHSDFASLVGLRDPDAALAQVSVLHGELRLGFPHFPVAHVKSNDIATVPRHKAADARGSMQHAAALPLTYVHLKLPESAFKQDKGAYMVALIVPV